MGTKLLHEDTTFKIRGAAFRVFNNLGFGHKEQVYQRALAIEFDKGKINYNREPKLEVVYDNKRLGSYIPDFLVEDKVIVELKAAKFFPPDLDKQMINYLKVTGCQVALAINFGQEKIEIRRRIWTRKSA